MANNVSPRSLRFALNNVWTRISARWFKHEGKGKASGEEIRNIVGRWLEAQPTATANFRRCWHPLSDAEKQDALIAAFPDRDCFSGAYEARQYVIEVLSDYNERFEGILKLIGDKRSLTRDEKSRAQELLKALKEDLDIHRKETNEGTGEMTVAERNDLYPAIAEARARIHVRWNGDPLKSRPNLVPVPATPLDPAS
jgi:hypothetical protein